MGGRRLDVRGRRRRDPDERRRAVKARRHEPPPLKVDKLVDNHSASAAARAAGLVLLCALAGALHEGGALPVTRSVRRAGRVVRVWPGLSRDEREGLVRQVALLAADALGGAD